MKAQLRFAYIGLFLSVLTFSSSQAQTYLQDGLRFSQPSVTGTARFQGFAGAGSALGGDISASVVNPAGLGFYTKSEFSFSGALGFASNQSDYLDNKTRDGKAAFTVPELGVVFSSGAQNRRGAWKGGSFAVSMQRVSNFQNQFSYQGVNNRTAFLDYLAENASSLNATTSDMSTSVIDDYGFRASGNAPYSDALALAQLAYKTYLINPIPTADTVATTGYFASIGQTFSMDQRETINTTGGVNQWNAAYGGNIDDKFYFGANVSVLSINYGSEKALTERVVTTSPIFIEGQQFANFIDNYTYTERLNASGAGINISGGFIYRPNDLIRFGASITSPTSIRIKESFSKEFNVNLYPGAVAGGTTNYSANNNPAENRYTIRKPWKASGGLAIFLGKNGFVTADAEYIPYNTLNVTANGDSFSGDLNYKPVVNLRLGGEYRMDIFRLRAGFARQEDPFRQTNNLNRQVLNFTLGGGVRQNNWFLDVAAVHTRTESGYTPYTVSFEKTPSAITKNAFTNIVFTVGTSF